jgi:alkylation response protein AidB-like acyl-CoA dehydrogenase
MTDGAARAIELYGSDELKRGALHHLTSSDPKQFWTSGQWMTERTGGSDVSGTSTVAKPAGSEYRLHGIKWFTSATTSQMAMTLARIEGAPEGSKGLSLFYVKLRDGDGKLQGIRVNRLKDKLGTRALPTAELTLEGCPATLLGSPGDGVKKISSLFNITRIYNSCCAVGYMRRAVALARDYALKRRAFGKLLSEHPLHLETLSKLQVEFEAAFHLTFRTVELLGKDETGKATPAESATLRLLTPLVKLYTAKQAVALTSEALEAFGGAGYIEDTGLPRLLRDSQVLSIWEGTTNVLSLDALRAIAKENAAEPFLDNIESRLGSIQTPELTPLIEKTRKAAGTLRGHVEALVTASESERQITARNFAYGMARTYAASLLIEFAEWSCKRGYGTHALVSAKRWCSEELVPPLDASPSRLDDSRVLALDLSGD